MPVAPDGQQTTLVDMPKAVCSDATPAETERSAKPKSSAKNKDAAANTKPPESSAKSPRKSRKASPTDNGKLVDNTDTKPAVADSGTSSVFGQIPSPPCTSFGHTCQKPGCVHKFSNLFDGVVPGFGTEASTDTKPAFGGFGQSGFGASPPFDFSGTAAAASPFSQREKGAAKVQSEKTSTCITQP